jgi:hypothetical protein
VAASGTDAHQVFDEITKFRISKIFKLGWHQYWIRVLFIFWFGPEVTAWLRKNQSLERSMNRIETLGNY